MSRSIKRAHLRTGVVFAALALLAAPVRTSAEMIYPSDDWQIATPKSQGVDPEQLAGAIQFLESNVGRDGVREVVIIRNGRMLWKGDNIDNVHGIWSGTKSFTSTVLGLLVEDGKCRLDSKAQEFLPAMADTFPNVTLRHFATMTSGYYAVGDEPKGSYTHGPSNTPFEPGAKPLFQPGSAYAYWDSAMNQFANVLTHIAGEPIDQLFKRRIADPIGMNSDRWRWGDFGKVDGLKVNGGSGNGNKHVFISARELARFGHLFLNEGRWKGKQLIAQEWVREATSVQVPASLPLGHRESGIDGRGVYGLNWWVNGNTPEGERIWTGAPPGTFAASGFNNNKCFVIPEWKMVIVRLGLDGNVPAKIWGEFFAKLSEAVAPLPDGESDAGRSEGVFECDFESDDWFRGWGEQSPGPRVETVDSDPVLGFVPHRGKALRVRIDQGGHYGTSLTYRFKEQLGEEPEEINLIAKKGSP